MKIAGLVVWVLTAGIGVYLLAAGIAAQRPAGVAAGGSASGGGPAGAAASGSAAGDGPAGAAVSEQSALLEFMHPLLALTGLTFWIFFVMTDDRVFAWIAFGVVVAAVLAGASWVVTGRRAARRPGGGAGATRPVAPGTVGTVASRTTESRTAAPETAAARHAFPARLVVIHGLAAACTLALVVIAAATAAGHG